MSLIGWTATTIVFALAVLLVFDGVMGGGIVADVWWVLTGRKRK